MAITVGVAVGEAVGAAVGVAVGVTVGADVGVAVGVAVGVDVGVAVGVAVGAAVGEAVGVAVGGAGHVLVGTWVRQVPIAHPGKLSVSYVAVSPIVTDVIAAPVLNACSPMEVTCERSIVFRALQRPKAKPSMVFTEHGMLIEDNLRELSKPWCRITVNVDGRTIDFKYAQLLKA